MEPDVLVVGEALVDVVHAGDGSVSERAGGRGRRQGAGVGAGGGARGAHL